MMVVNASLFTLYWGVISFVSEAKISGTALGINMCFVGLAGSIYP